MCQCLPHLPSHSSTRVDIRTGLANLTFSPSREFMLTMCLLPSSKSTLWTPANSFFKWVWIMEGLVAWPRI